MTRRQDGRQRTSVVAPAPVMAAAEEMTVMAVRQLLALKQLLVLLLCLKVVVQPVLVKVSGRPRRGRRQRGDPR